MVIKNSMCISMFTFKQPLGWLNWYNPVSVTVMLFYYFPGINWGPLPFLKGTPKKITGSKWKGYQPHSCLFNSGAPIYIWYKSKNIYIFFFKYKMSPIFLTSTSYIIKRQCPAADLPMSGRRNQHPELGKKCRYPRCLVGPFLSKVAKICT